MLVASSGTFALGGALYWAVCVGVSFWLGVKKNRAILGLLLGMFLTIIGVVIMLIVKPSEAHHRTLA